MTSGFHTRPDGPAVVLMSEDDARALVFRLQCFPAGGVVRVIRGSHCESYERLHGEIAAALQFPYYYGENWDALDECITDLEWAPGNYYLLHVSTVEHVLPSDPASFNVFLRILVAAHNTWASMTEATPFHTVVSGSAEGLARVKNAIGAGEAAEA